MCPNKEVKTMDLMGCKDGGFPRCKDIDGQIYNEGPFSMMDDMVCPASSKHITTKDFMHARLLKSTKCLCEDSRVPICVRGTSSTGVCPDGSDPDTSNVIMPPFLKNCSPRKWIFANVFIEIKSKGSKPWNHKESIWIARSVPIIQYVLLFVLHFWQQVDSYTGWPNEISFSKRL